MIDNYFLPYIKTKIAECERVEKVIKWSGRSWNHIFNLRQLVSLFITLLMHIIQPIYVFSSLSAYCGC